MIIMLYAFDRDVRLYVCLSHDIWKIIAYYLLSASELQILEKNLGRVRMSTSQLKVTFQVRL